MSWLEKLLPAKIQQTNPSERRSVPEGLWIKCPSCESVLYKTDLEHNQNVCPTCGHHHRIGARARLNAFLMHHRDLPGGAAKADAAQLEPVAQRLPERGGDRR